MIELEKTYLAKELPKNLKKCKHKKIIDFYIPKTSSHPKLRLRQIGTFFEITKKEPIKKGDASSQLEQTIELTKKEFQAIFSQVKGKKIIKKRYYYKHNGLIAEFDVFEAELKGLVVVDFEFKNAKEKNNFKAPSFCLAEITQETFIAGGMICGKTYSQIAKHLNKFNYKKLYL